MHQIKISDLAAINAPYKEKIERKIAGIIDAGRFIGGPEVEALEKRLAGIVGTEYAIGTGNGLDALRMILFSLVIKGYLKKGDKVLVPANTYIASLLAVVHAGLVPVPVDVDERTMVITAETVEKAMTSEIKAIMPVHLYGRVAWDEDIKEIAERRGLIVIEDNAQAIGAKSSVTGLTGESRFTGALGHAGAFSFYPTKNIGALGDGGAVTTNLPDIAETVRALANYGSIERFRNVYIGYNSRLDPIQAGAVSIKLEDLRKVCERRQENARRLNEGIKAGYTITPPLGHDDSMVWHQYVVTLEEDRRDLFRKLLAEAGVETDIHYPLSPFLQPCFNNDYVGTVSSMTAAKLSKKIVSLPVNETISEEEIHYICSVINSIKL